MKSHSLSIFTRTPLHVGIGSSVGALDQPVHRERHSHHPIIPGSAIKGVIRNHYYHLKGETFCEGLFGQADNNSGQAGLLSFTEAKVLLFPVRSAAGAFAMVTCNTALSRLCRDKKILIEIPNPHEGNCLATDLCKIDDQIVLEEYVFHVEGSPSQEIINAVCKGLINDPILDAATERLVILSDEDFSFFVKNATEIRNHNRLNPETGTVDGSGFFNEEVIPAETLFFASIFETRQIKEEQNILSDFGEETLLQFGGNATAGLGFCTVKSQPI